MNKEGFFDAIRRINDKDYRYGNEVLYKMASKADNLFDPAKLSGAMWLIGRSYAASPQRRSYGTIKGEKRKINSSDDGREWFFEHIAEDINKIGFINDSIICQLRNSYSYDESEEDKELLVASISLVLNFNLALSKALEKFDGVENNENENGDSVYCSNHISFSSKFLHFYFPNSVFIIDHYAFDGGKSLFNGNEEKSKRYLSYGENAADEEKGIDCFDQSVYDSLPKDKIKNLEKELKNRGKIRDLNDKYKDRKRVFIPADRAEVGMNDKYKDRKRDSEGDKSKIDDYIGHCVRSYLLGKYIKEKIPDLKLKEQIEGKEGFAPMTRLTDAVFLNVKRPKEEKE